MKTPLLLAALMVASSVASASPFITRHPQSRGITEGESTSLSVEADVRLPASYQWRRNGVNIAGATERNLPISGSAIGSTFYDVVISDATGLSTSRVATVRVESSRLINISTRGFVGTGDGQTLVAGFVIRGQSRNVLIRAVGPSLIPLGVGNALPNPVLTLRNAAGNIVAVNDDWAFAGDIGVVAAIFGMVGAFPFASVASKDAVVQMGLQAGSYTVEVTASLSGNDARTGVALLEVYEIPDTPL
jgi:hypothetical protein